MLTGSRVWGRILSPFCTSNSYKGEGKQIKISVLSPELQIGESLLTLQLRQKLHCSSLLLSPKCQSRLKINIGWHSWSMYRINGCKIKMRKACIVTKKKKKSNSPFSLTFFHWCFDLHDFLHCVAQESHQLALRERLAEYTETAFWWLLV